MAAEEREYVCAGCGKTTQAKRLPPGWHRLPSGDVMCATCWKDRYVLRAVTIPVAGPTDCEWSELRDWLKAAWRATVRLSNWAITQLAKADVVRTPEMEKLPKAPAVYLYPEARKLCPELEPSTVCAVLHAVEGRWRKRRYNVIWLGNESVPNFRYDRAVLPIRAKDWRALRDEQGRPVVRIRLAGRQVHLRLRGGHDYRRQLAAFEKLLAGEALRAEVALYEQKGSSGDHRPGIGKVGRLLCKMCLWLPRDGQPDGSRGLLFVMPGEDCLLQAVNAKQNKLWTINADHVARWQREHQRRLRRLSEDAKMEVRGKLRSRFKSLAEKYRRRMDTAAHQLSAQVVGYAKRNGFAGIVWLDTEPRRNGFPWHTFVTQLQHKAHGQGLSFITGKELPNGEDRVAESKACPAAAE